MWFKGPFDCIPSQPRNIAQRNLNGHFDCIPSQPKNKCTFSRSSCQCWVSPVYRICPPSDRGLTSLGHLLPNQGGASRQHSMLLKHIRTPDFLAVAHWKKFIGQSDSTWDRSTLHSTLLLEDTSSGTVACYHRWQLYAKNVNWPTKIPTHM